jgi:hypothetical protein
MARRAILVGIPAMAAAGLTILLNHLHAGAGAAAASLGLVAVLGGAAIGYFADRLPERPPARQGAATPRGRGAGLSS